ncbi:MAG: cyclic nucleotide-binding domain-containing protein, partial [bacterium]|nr:cyclic nucleotide-binding domain-containing protein [bacterium]
HAVEAFAAHGRTQELHPLYDDPSVGVRSAVVRGLLSAATDDADTQFERLADDDDPAARAAAAGLHMLTGDGAARWFTRLLADPHEDVVAATLRGGARSQRPPWPQGWLQFFASPRLRPAATELAQAWARQDAAVLVDCVDAADTPDSARLALVAALEAATDGVVASALQRWLQSADDALRGATLAVILTRRDRGGVPPPGANPVEQCLSRELEAALSWQSAARDLLHLADPLLDDALRRRFMRARDRCLMCLDLLFADLSHSRVSRSLTDREPRQAAAAIELIDQVLPRRLATGLLPLFDEAAGTVSGVGPENLLAALADTPDPWLSACATHALQKLHHPDETGAITMPLSVLEKVFFLKSVSLFHSLSGEEIAQIVPIVGEMEYAAGDMIIKRGQEGDCLYILVEGDVSVTLADGRQRLLTSREVIGELAVLAERPRSADCRAVSDVVALRIDKTAFWQLLDERPDIAIEVMKVLVDRYVPSDG